MSHNLLSCSVTNRTKLLAAEKQLHTSCQIAAGPSWCLEHVLMHPRIKNNSAVLLRRPASWWVGWSTRHMINSPSDLSGPLDEGFTTFHVLIASATVVGSNHLVAASSMCVMDSRGRGTTQSCVGKHACTGL